MAMIRAAFLIESEPDERGRQRFTMYWWNGHRNRAQCFFTVLEKHTRKVAFPLVTKRLPEATDYGWRNDDGSLRDS